MSDQSNTPPPRSDASLPRDKLTHDIPFQSFHVDSSNCYCVSGFPVDDLLGREAGCGFPPDLATELRSLNRAVLSSGKPTKKEVTSVIADDLRRFEVKVVPILSQSGSVEGASTVIFDVTAYRKEIDSQKALAEHLSDASHDCICVLDFDGRLLYMNKRATECAGIDDSDLYWNQPWADFWHGKYAIAARKAVQKAAGGGIGRFIGRCPVEERGSLWFNVTVSGLADDAGSERLVAVYRDVTERMRLKKKFRRAKKRLEEATQKAEQQKHEAGEKQRLLSGIMAYIPEGVVVADTQAIMRVVSPFGLSYTDREMSDVIGRSLRDYANERAVYRADGVTRYLADELPLIRALEKGESITDEESIVYGADGRQVTLLCNAGPLYNESHERIGAVLTYRDISTYKRLLFDYEALTETLEKQVRERTSQVRGLAIDVMKAEQRERQRIARILHDDLQQTLVALQFQLTGMQRMNASDERPDLTENVDYYVNLVKNAIETCRTLTVDLNPPISQEGEIQTAIEWLAQRKKRLYDLNTHMEIRGNGNTLSQDVRVFLFEAARELLFNVVKHAGVLEASLLIDINEQGVSLVVEDNGRGCHSSTTTEMGSGLRRIQKRLELLGGSLSLEASASGGTRAVLELPREDAE